MGRLSRGLTPPRGHRRDSERVAGCEARGGILPTSSPSAAPAPRRAPKPPGTPASRTVAGVSADGDQTPGNSPDGHRSTKKNSLGMTLAAPARACFGEGLRFRSRSR
jgi:hypothetical protein